MYSFLQIRYKSAILFTIKPIKGKHRSHCMKYSVISPVIRRPEMMAFQHIFCS